MTPNRSACLLGAVGCYGAGVVSSLGISAGCVWLVRGVRLLLFANGLRERFR